MTVHTRRGLATHGLRGLTGRNNRRLAVATQGVRGYITVLIGRILARFLNDVIKGRVLLRRE